MFRMGAVTDDDKLDDEATRQVLRRASRHGHAVRRTTFAGALAFAAAVDARPRCSDP